MKINWPIKGKYIVAVSGGVDSVCLLNMLVEQGGYQLVVAHADHGIRADSPVDAELVQQLAKTYDLAFEVANLKLPAHASESQARQKRYEFLFDVMNKYQAAAVITAHHADDLIETSILNIQRRTDRYGAAGGMRRPGILRPLLKVDKSAIRAYAKQHDLRWNEDYTNQQAIYARNQIRHNVIPKIDRAEYESRQRRLLDLNQQIDEQLEALVNISGNEITINRLNLAIMDLRQAEVLLAYALQKACPAVELTLATIGNLAHQLIAGKTKIAFALSGFEGIIIVSD